MYCKKRPSSTCRRPPPKQRPVILAVVELRALCCHACPVLHPPTPPTQICCHAAHARSPAADTAVAASAPIPTPTTAQAQAQAQNTPAQHHHHSHTTTTHHHTPPRHATPRHATPRHATPHHTTTPPHTTTLATQAAPPHLRHRRLDGGLHHEPRGVRRGAGVIKIHHQ